MMRHTPIMVMFLSKKPSMKSLKQMPTTATGMQEMRILTTVLKLSSRFQVKNDTQRGANSRQSTTMVLRTVATWSMTSNSRLASGSSLSPRSLPQISRWPDELMGRYSARPWTMPMMRALSVSIIYLSVIFCVV